MNIISKYGDYNALIDEMDENRVAFKKRCISDLRKYSDIISDYKTFLILTSSFLKEITIKDNSINTALTISSLLNNFSYGNKFKDDNDKDVDIVFSVLGMNVIYGEGCCRHCSEFTRDLLDMMGISNENFYCKLDECNINHQLHEKALHLTNLIEYEDIVNGEIVNHVFDVLNGSLFKFIGATKLENYTKDLYLSYLPRLSLTKDNMNIEDIERRLILFESQSKSEQLSANQYVEILKETRSKIEENRKIISDYNHDAQSIKEKIYIKSSIAKSKF